MKDFKSFIDLLKLPPTILFVVSLVTGIILFLPEDYLNIFYMGKFRENFGFYIGIVFLLSTVMLLVLIVTNIYKKIKEKYDNKKYKEARIKYLKQLDKSKTDIIQRFIDCKDHTMALPANNGSIIELENFGLITLAGNTQLVYDDFQLLYFLQPWVMRIISEDEELKQKFL